jgi:flavodoxin
MSHVLIAYYSWGGKTRQVAQQLQTLTGGDVLEITTKKQYPQSYILCVGAAKLEMMRGTLPELTVAPRDLSAYDTVLLGYPIWWFTAPLVVISFVKQFDLSGKKVGLFCTSGSSPVEKSEPALYEACPGATFLPSLTANDPASLAPWVQQLGLSK